jgi:phage tail-like protein
MAASRVDPYQGFRFQVQIESLVVAGFSEVSGLSMELETEDVPEGGVNSHAHRLPKRFSYPNLVLRRGMTDSPALVDWISAAVDGTIERKRGEVFMLDATGTAVWGWAFERAYPVTWTGPELQADGQSVAMESLELAHDGLSTVSGLPEGRE